MPIVALAALDPLFQAALATLLLLAIGILAKVLSAPFKIIPIVGGYLANAAETLMTGAMSASGSLFEGPLFGLVHLFDAARNTLKQLFDVTGAALGEFSYTLWHLATVSLPHVIALAYREVVTTEHRLQHYIAQVATTAYREVVSTERRLQAAIAAGAALAYREIVSTEHRLERDISDAAATAYREVVSTAARLEHDITDVAATAYREVVTTADRLEADAKDLFRTAEADIATATATAEAYAAARAAAAEQAAIAAVSAAATTGISVVWPGIVTDLGELDKTIAGAWPDIRDAVDAIPRAIPQDLTAAMGAVAALAIPALRAMDDCVLPQCRDLGGLRSFLHDLLGAASAAAILAWLIYCVAEPVAAADDTAAVAEPIANDTLGLLLRLFGIQT